ncbi:hypothetical protein Ancab_035404 [Ancistrocladus abbreviatus]
MADQHSTEGASTSESSGGSSESVVELNIKTLDSQIYSFHADKNMPVSLFKEKIANEIGVPVGQQRLIFRGKVLKDDHLLSEYHVENGHTLHLVERQPAPSQSSSGTSSGETNANSGGQANDGNTGAPRNRVGQISHSVVLGTFNVGDQGDGAVPDLNRVIGAVLNSLGIGNLATANTAVGGQSSIPSNPAGQPSQGTETGATRSNTGGQSQEGSQTQSGHPFPSPPFQFPLTGGSIPLPSLQTPIPDSLNTLSVFVNRLEGVLLRNGYHSNQSSTYLADQPAVELPTDARGQPAPEALSIVLRHAQQLVGGGVATMLSQIAGRLEQEAGSTDPSVRSQIQTEAVQLGLVMQHLGAFFLELGRTILTLRMGQSPAESGINAGPAVYISPSGPNPIMVQPFPLQTSSLFNTATGPSNMGTVGPLGLVGNAPRHINIHIHAVGARAGTAEVTQGERTGVAGPGDSGPVRVLPARNVIAAAVPAHPAAFAVSPISSTAQPIIGGSSSQPPDSASLTSVISEVNTRLRNLVGNMWVENQTSSGSMVQNSSTGLGGGSDIPIDCPGIVLAESAAETSESNMPEQAQKNLPDSEQSSNNEFLSLNDKSLCPVEASSSCLNQEDRIKPDKTPEDPPKSTEIHDKPEGTRDVPLGLGLGGLQPKKQSKQSKMPMKSGRGGSSDAASDQAQQVRASGERVLHSLASFGSAANGSDANAPATRQIPPAMEQVMAGSRPVRQGSDGQLDIANMMSQLVQSPVLGDMLRQFTQNPGAMNTVAQLAQQLNTDDLPMFAGLGGGQGGGVDLSRMVQQMMPIVSQALTGGSVLSEPFPTMDQSRPENANRRLSSRDSSYDQNSQVVQRVLDQNSPQDIFRVIIQNATELSHVGGHQDELVEELCTNEDLANEFIQTFRHDLSRRLQNGSGSG